MSWSRALIEYRQGTGFSWQGPCGINLVSIRRFVGLYRVHFGKPSNCFAQRPAKGALEAGAPQRRVKPTYEVPKPTH
jgi:hypothetical protein